MNKFSDKLICKLREKNGGVYLTAAFIIMGILLALAALVEYYRIYHSVSVADRAYEKAMLSVAIENYDEIFSSTRESTQIGGYFEGGNETVMNSDIRPGFDKMNDEGDIASELERLLKLQQADNNILSAYDMFGKELYTLSNFTMQITESSPSYGGAVNYHLQGSFDIAVPVYFIGERISTVRMTIPSKSVWKSRI